MASRGARMIGALRPSAIALAVLMAAFLLPTATSWAQPPAPVAEPAAAQPAESAPAPVAPPAIEAPATATSVTSRRIASPMRLADPAIAKKLALSTEQQAEIARLVAERDAAIAASDATGRPAVEARSDEQLLDVLDDDQQARWHHLARAK